MTFTQSQQQEALKERDQLIQSVQLQNIGLRGALRESDRLLRVCVALLLDSGVTPPVEVSNHLGSQVLAPAVKPELVLTEWQVKALKALLVARTNGKSWVHYGNQVYPVPTVRLLKEKGLIDVNERGCSLTDKGLFVAKQLVGKTHE
jgi:hypothetical protein